MLKLQVTLITLIFLHATSSAELTVQTRFSPTKIALGDRTQYIIEVVETDTKGIPSPETVRTLPISAPSGLNLINGRTSSSSQTNYVNGKGQFSHTQSFIFDAEVNRTGIFEIPEFEFTYKGQMLVSPSATLNVLERGTDTTAALEELIFLKTDLPKSLYVGQSVPASLKLYVEESISLSGLNSFERQADGYIISDLPKEAVESSEILNGRRFRVLTWPTSITPIQTGYQNLSFDLTLSVRTQQRSDPFGRRNPFGSSIFDDFFGKNERIEVSTSTLSVEVLPLPETGQPESFSGAVGDFSLQVYSDLKSTNVGEPIMLSVEIMGIGNFDRIQGPPMPEMPEWRSYEPESSFVAKDSLSLEGTKRFDYVFIPLQSGPLSLPKVVFSFLNPQTSDYVELKSPAINVTVSPNLTQLTSPSLATTKTIPSETTASTELVLSRDLSPEEVLFTLNYQQKPVQSIDNTLLKSKNYYIANALTLLICILLGIFLRQRRCLDSDPVFALRYAAKQELKKVKAQALETLDVGTFYEKASLSLRLAATYKFGKNLRNVGTEQICLLIEDSNTQKNARTLFASADCRRFAHDFKATDLVTTKEQLKTILKNL